MTDRGDARPVRWAEAAYRGALRWMPLRLDPGLERAAVEMFRDRVRAETRDHGSLAALVVLLRAIADLGRSWLASRVERRPRLEPSEGSRRRMLMSNLLLDVRHAVRQWRRTPSFPLTTLVALSLGIGIAATMFSVVSGILLRPLPFPAPDELVQVWDSNPRRNLPRYPTSPANLVDWRASADAFAELAGYTTSTVTVVMGDDAHRVPATAAQSNLLDLLGVPVALGRGFAASDERPESAGVVIVGHRLWISRFGGDPDIIGLRLLINDELRRVIGVLAEDVALAPDTDLWLPLVFDFGIFQARGAKFVRVVGRLRPDTSLSVAQAQLDAVSATLARTHPDTDGEWHAVIVPLHDQLVGQVAPALVALSGGVGLLMLLACANVLSLQIAQLTARKREFALRQALGAGRARLIRQNLVETTLLSLVSAGVGLGLAYVLTSLVIALQPGNLPRVENIVVDGQVLAFVTGLAVVVGLGVGLVSAVMAGREGWRSPIAGGLVRADSSHRIRRAVLVVQIAVAVMLFSGFGLVARSLYGLLTTDPGFVPAGLMAATVTPPRSRYPEAAQRATFYHEVAERLRAMPHIANVSVTTRLPMTGLTTYSYAVDRPPFPPVSDWSQGQLRAVGPDYFATLRIPLREGRLFTALDDARAPAVVVINETMARQLNLGADLLGTRLHITSGDVACPCGIIGVVADVRETGLETPPVPVYYLPEAQSIWTTRSLIVRSDAPADEVALAMRAAVASVDPMVPLYDVGPVDRIIDRRLASPRFNAWLMGVFAAFALGLTTAGIFGVTSFVVSQRMPELAVRAALGAGRSRLVWLVERDALGTAAAGLAIGIGGTVASAGYVQSLLVNLSPLDAPVLASSVGSLGVASALAALVPATRAGRADPIDSLRVD
ncbi:MAG TPA: ABC transporter permease [Vicinamibacterales bacterium]|nr:ABC transporter permease [Vicinamibacterales bacterium]